MKSHHTQPLYLAQEIFITSLGDIKPLGFDLMLCGGTALARGYLHHRISYDLDFFVDVRIPDQTGRPVHGKLDTDSRANWTLK